MPIKIKKLESAKRQLDTAIQLYFTGGDIVSIHTLASASYDIIKDTNKDVMLIKHQFIELMKSINPELSKEYKDRLNAPQNFFKHADKDPDGVLTFDPIFTELFIIDACEGYRCLTAQYPVNFSIYKLWFMMPFWEHLEDGSADKTQLKNMHSKYMNYSKEKFYAAMKQVIAHEAAEANASTP